MADRQPRVRGLHSGEFVAADGVLPGAVVAAVGYHCEGLAPQLHRGLASPYLTFIFSLGEPIVSGPTPAEAIGSGADRNGVLVAGLHEAPTYVVQPPTQSGLQLALHPLAARAIFGAPASRLPDQVTEGSDLLGSAADEVREQLAEAAGWDRRFSIVTRYLRRRVTDQPVGRRRGRRELAEAWRWLAVRGGGGSMDELAGHVSLSGRQLRSLFAAELGMGPKQVGARMRFDRSRQRLARATASGTRVLLSDLAAECGYYDHAHLVADFHRFAGLSPSAWVAEERRNIQTGGHVRGADSLS